MRSFIFAGGAQPFKQVVFAQDMNDSTGEAERDKPQTEKEPGRQKSFWFLKRWAGGNGGVMGSMKNWMLAAAVLTGAAGLGSMKAQAAEIGVYVRGPVAYVPPSPGPGYFWTDGYMSGGYWVPGRWAFRGYDRDRFVRRDFDRGRYFDGDRNRDRDRDRHFDRDRR